MSKARLSVLHCYNIGHNGHRINLYGVIMTRVGNLHAGGQSSLGHLSLLHRSQWNVNDMTWSMIKSPFGNIIRLCVSVMTKIKYYHVFPVRSEFDTLHATDFFWYQKTIRLMACSAMTLVNRMSRKYIVLLPTQYRIVKLEKVVRFKFHEYTLIIIDLYTVLYNVMCMTLSCIVIVTFCFTLLKEGTQSNAHIQLEFS